MPGNGWCTHPKRQLNSGVKLLVRAAELACRNTWGGDLFVSRLDDDPSLAAAADLPANDRDDEVTSVSIPSNTPVPAEDRVVHDRPAAQRRPRLDSNDAAHRDQEERARLMARGNRDALAHARQRISNRRQAVPEEDVVADDDTTDASGSDRVVTRQQRFSDRDFASGIPPLRTEPVPREEVRQRGIASEDRFDTIPEIDPDFDMPGQRHRSEPVAASAAAPEPPAELPGLPELDQDQLTAYEYVLQRARRIRETKQEHARPLRHADFLPARDKDALETAPGWHELDSPTLEREPIDRFDEPVPAELATYPMDEAPELITYDDTPASWAGTYDEGAWDDAGEASTVEPWKDEEPAWEADDEAWDDEDWDEDHAYVDEPAPRRSGWLQRLGFGRRSAEPVHDDAIITRHAASSDAWDEDEPYEFDDEPLFERQSGADLPEYDEEPVRWDADPNPAHRDDRDRWDDADPDPAWPDHEPAIEARLWSGHDHAAQQRQAPSRAWQDNDLPRWQDPTSTRVYAEGYPAPAPVPAPVPTSERASGSWDIAGMPVRPAPSPRSQPRLTTELPDLDDALFDGDRVIRAERQADMRGEMNRPHQPGSASPRDSFFRASRYPQPEHTASFRESPAAMAHPPESTLPDLGGDRLDVRDAVERGSELIDRRIEVAPEIPRECRTCRSFRSADGGTRGWCTNEWAFTHRRMVNEDDLACVSAIGCWWMPADHLRLDLDDEPDHVRTPRMDELIARNRPAARKVSGE